MTPRERYEIQITLHDGRVVGSWSQEWLAECEARRILALPTKTMRWAELGKIEAKRGREAKDKVTSLVWAIWEHERKVNGSTE